MSARVLAGKPVQEEILAEVEAGVIDLVAAGHRPPHLTAVLVGNDPASEIYVRTKTRKCSEVGILSGTLSLPTSTTTDELLDRVQELNSARDVDGILVQLPLPDAVDSSLVVDAIDPAKDVDGLHPENVGRLTQGRPRFVPATPAGIVELLARACIEVEGKHAVVIGRSDIVGRPMAALLLHRNATVTVCHSRTPDLGAVARSADILIAAVGRAGLIGAGDVKPGSTVIDVGINRVADRDEISSILGDRADWERFDERGYLVVGDVHPDAMDVAGAMTPVPGGVGPLTIGMLLVNTLTAARVRRGIA